MRSQLLDQDSPNKQQYVLDLSNSLSNLTILQRDEYKESSEGVRPTRHVLHQDPETIQCKLGCALTNLADRFIEINLPNQSVDAAKKSVEIFNSFPKEAHRDELALALFSYYNALFGIGVYDQALSEIKKATNILSQNTSTLDINISLLIYSNVFLQHSFLGNEEDARSALLKVRALVDSSASYPTSVEPELGRSLLRLSSRCQKLGDWKEAANACEDAVKVFRRLIQEPGEPSKEALALSLNGLSTALYFVGSHEETLEYHDEALQIWRDLSDIDPQTFNPNLAFSLSAKAVDLYRLKRYDLALKHEQEALEIWEKLVELIADPIAFEPHLGNSLYNIALDLREFKCYLEAFERDQQGLAIWRRLAEQDPPTFNLYLANCLLYTAMDLRMLGHYHRALRHDEQSLAIYQDLSGSTQFVSALHLPPHFTMLQSTSVPLIDIRKHFFATQRHYLSIRVVSKLIERDSLSLSICSAKLRLIFVS